MNNRHRRVNRLKAEHQRRIIKQNKDRWDAFCQGMNNLAMAIGESFGEVIYAREWQEDENWNK